MIDGRLWHGGIGGLKVGDRVLPPSMTGNGRIAAIRRELLAQVPGFDPSVVTPDDVSQEWVHFTPHRKVALAYAASCFHDFRHGALYVVEPIGDVETDPDMPVQSLRAHEARVITVYDPYVSMSRDKAARLHASAAAVEQGTSVREQYEGLRRYTDRARSRPDPGQLIRLPPR